MCGRPGNGMNGISIMKLRASKDRTMNSGSCLKGVGPWGVLPVCIMFFLFFTGCAGNKPLAQGDILPAFMLQTIDHTRFYANRQKGHVTVLVFWATWCNYCKQELIEIKKLPAQFAPGRVMVAGICTDPENAEQIRQVVQGFHINFPMLLDEGARLFKRLGLNAYPTTVAVDPDGRVIMIAKGFSETVYHQMMSKITLALEAGNKG